MAVRDAETLAEWDGRPRPGQVLAAAWLGRTRLIDNVPVPPGWLPGRIGTDRTLLRSAVGKVRIAVPGEVDPDILIDLAQERIDERRDAGLT